MEINAKVDSDKKHVEGAMLHRRALYAYFQDMVPLLAKAFPERTILIRPHPAESHEPWKDLAGQHNNVVVAAEGNVVPWLMACDVLLHNGCTTSIEAAILDTPSVAYQPVQSDGHDNPFPNALSHPAYDEKSLVDQVNAILEGRLGPLDSEESRRLIERHIAARNGELACDRMLDVLDEMGFRKNSPPASGRRKRFEGWIRSELRTAQKKRNGRKRGHRNSPEYHDHRFPEIPLAEIRSRVIRFAKHLGRFDDLQVSPVSRHVFRVERVD
jgi:hypothetical protein